MPASPILTKEQKDDLLRLLAEDETYPTVAKKVGCSLITVKRYAAKYAGEIATAAKEYRAQHYRRGFANVDYRVRKLARVAEVMEEQLEANDYLAEEVKISGSGVTVRYKVRDEASIRQYRGAMDDIAKEQGERKNINELTGPGGGPLKTYISISPDDWDNAVKQNGKEEDYPDVTNSSTTTGPS